MSANQGAPPYYARAVQCYNPFAMTTKRCPALVAFRRSELIASMQALPGPVPRTRRTDLPAFRDVWQPPPL